LRTELEALRQDLGPFEFTFTDGLATGDALVTIVANRIRATISARRLARPAVVVVDHGGPAAASAALRDQIAASVRIALGDEIGPLNSASMEGAHPPLLAPQLDAEGFAHRDVIVAPLFLSPGRHAGPDGDIAQICRTSSARCHLTDLVGTHPLAVDALAAALHHTLSTLHAPSFA
jgi:sirohydrochlorin ferrochelatase